MTAPWMPPLPEPVAWADRDGDLYVMPERQNWHPPHQMLYTDDQMRRAQADAARAALEAAAKLCRSRAALWRIRVVPMLGIAAELDVAADAIEQMAKEIT